MRRTHRAHTLVLALTVTASVMASSMEALASGGWVPPPPSLPPPPPGSTCITIQRGGLGNVHDSDVAPGNGNWAPGAYPLVWTGLSASEHWTVVKGDLSPIPPGSQIVLSTFSIYVGWNDSSSQVHAHQVLADWAEPTVTWGSFGGTASWNPASLASFDPSGVGYKSIDITGITQAWYSGMLPNHGLLLEEGLGPVHGYYASEAGSQAYRPRFDVCYAAGGPCAGKQNGDACDDGNLCTTGEVCSGGQCGGGQTVTCAALDGCHDAGVCDPATGQCTNPVKGDDSPCDDGDACTEMEVCIDGQCTGGNQVVCNDGDACTTDACDPATGCTAAPVSCADSLACTADLCAGGSCEHVIGCPPGQPCSPSFCTTPEGQDPQFAWLCQ